MRKLYAYESERAALQPGGDPHAVRILLSNKDYHTFQGVRIGENAYLGRHEVGGYTYVTDQRTEKRYKIATAPCGLGCRCAAIAILVCSECERDDGIMTDSGLCVTCHTRLNGETEGDE